MTRALAYSLVTFVLAAVGVFVAAQVTLVTFKAGDLIRADEVNANFRALADAIDTSQLPATCESGQVPEWDGARWACGADDVGAGGGGGDITAVRAGEGLKGGSASGEATLSVAFEGSGSAASAARSDHDHADRYYTKAEVDAAVSTVAGAEAVATAGVSVPSTLTVQYAFPSLGEAFTTSQAGKLMLSKYASVNLACAVATDRLYFLTVDGVPVRSSVHLQRSDDSKLIGTLVGVTEAAVPAGAHTLGVGGQCYSGDAGIGSLTDVFTSGSVVVLP